MFLNCIAIRTISINAKIVPAQNIPYTPQKFNNIAPNTGPTINPRPKNAPMSQKFFDFSSGVGEISAKIACKIEILPPVIPLITLEIRKRI